MSKEPKKRDQIGGEGGGGMTMLQADPQQPGSILLHIKAVPGARKNEIAGRLGDRLKVRVSAPPEGGKANAAIIDLVAQTLGVATNAVVLVRGQSQPMKTLSIRSVSVEQAQARLADI